MAGGTQGGAGIRGPPVLPDDRIVDRLARYAIPDDCRLALVGDADAGNILGAGAGLRHRFPHGCDDSRPDVLGIVLDPSWRRIDLPQLLLRGGDRGELCIEHDGACRGGALIDSDEVPHCSHSTSTSGNLEKIVFSMPVRCQPENTCLTSCGGS